jgi:hypothetical protein
MVSILGIRTRFIGFCLILNNLICFSTFAIELEVNRFLNIATQIDKQTSISESDSDYFQQVQTLFKNLKSLEIGGTHTYGNKTIIKQGQNQGQLDPSILILNPSQKAHDLNDETVLSIIGSGWDVNLLDQLIQITQTLDHHFDKVYLNNLLYMLPIAEGLSTEELSKPQQYFFSSEENPDDLAKQLELAFSTYYEGTRNGLFPNLYQRYWKLLNLNGIFLYKSGSQTQLKSALDGAYISHNFRSSTTNPNELENAQEKLDQLFMKLHVNLNKIGDMVYLDAKDIQPSLDVPSVDLIRTFRLQMAILEYSQLKVTRAGVGLFNGWGFHNHEELDQGYSMVIQAKKQGTEK